MNVWRRLLHPWWRPALLTLNVIALLLLLGSRLFGYTIGWQAPIFVLNLVTVAMTWREGWINSDPLKQRAKAPEASEKEPRTPR